MDLVTNLSKSEFKSKSSKNGLKSELEYYKSALNFHYLVNWFKKGRKHLWANLLLVVTICFGKLELAISSWLLRVDGQTNQRAALGSKIIQISFNLLIPGVNHSSWWKSGLPAWWPSNWKARGKSGITSSGVTATEVPAPTPRGASHWGKFRAMRFNGFQVTGFSNSVRLIRPEAPTSRTNDWQPGSTD